MCFAIVQGTHFMRSMIFYKDEFSRIPFSKYTNFKCLMINDRFIAGVTFNFPELIQRITSKNIRKKSGILLPK